MPPAMSPMAYDASIAALHAMAAAFGQRVVPMDEEVVGGGDDTHSCRVCFDKPREVCLHPCHHIAVCDTCFRGIRQLGQGCPVCRAPFTHATRVYL